jgi:hypothetical protein
LSVYWGLAGEKPMLRIPVAGPEPFNTLVVVRGGALWTTRAPWPSDGDTYRWIATAKTPFILQGFDQRVDPVFDHSTTVVWQFLNVADDTTFLIAEDAVIEGRFDEEGRWEVSTLVAASAGEGMRGQAFVSSWVLCYEPRPPERPAKPHPSGITIVEEREPYAAALALTREKHPDRGAQMLRPRRRRCEDERGEQAKASRASRSVAHSARGLLQHLSPTVDLTAELLADRRDEANRNPAEYREVH